VSQLGRAKASRSLVTTRNIARILGVPIAVLFGGGTETDDETDRFGR
jgi:hypothetical protein